MKRSFVSTKLCPPPGYAHIVEVTRDSIVFTAGAVPLDEKGDLVGQGSLLKQTKKVISNLKTVLEERGLDTEHIVKTNIYVVSDKPNDLSSVWEIVRAEGFANENIASTLLGVSSLGYSEQLVEIELIAAR